MPYPSIKELELKVKIKGIKSYKSALSKKMC